MHRFILLALGASTFATAAPLELTHQMRLTDALGTPIDGVQEVEVRLWSHATSTDSEEQLWVAELEPTFSNGYASLLLNTGVGDVAIDSNWFDDGVWVELVVGTQTLSPRSKITDVPGARATGSAGQSTGPIFMSGPNLARHPAVTLTPGVSTYPHNEAAIRFSGWSTRFDPLIDVALLAPGEAEAAEQVRVHVEIDYVCSSSGSDCDPAVLLIDGAGAWCRVAAGDSDQYWVSSSESPSEVNITWPRASSNEQLVWNIFTHGPGNDTLFSAYSQRPDNSAQPRWACASTLAIETGLRLQWLGDHTYESYDLHYLTVQLDRI